MKVLIIGGVAGGASAAARLRRLDESAEIIMFERGGYISFANCGLPYYVGGSITEKSALTLQTPDSFRQRFNVDVRIWQEVIAIHPERQAISVRRLDQGDIYEESYDRLLLSPGAEAKRPPLPGIDHPRIFTLRNIPDAYRLRDQAVAENNRRAVIIGGGYIGMEMAESLNRAGLSVIVIERSHQVLPQLDYDMACGVQNYLRDQGITLLLQRSISGFREMGDGVAVLLGADEIPADIVLLAIGVKPESGLAQAAGLEIDSKGCIVVNRHLQTSDPNIYAVGDAIQVRNFVTGQPAFIPLAGPANKQGRLAADHIAGLAAEYQGTQGSSILKLFDMTVATTGINESEARLAGLDYDKVFTHPVSHASYYPGFTNMTIKTIFEKSSGKILGAQLFGFEGVDKRCDVMATAIRAGMRAKDLTELELCYAPPFSSAKDPVNMIGYVIENLLKGLVHQYHWDQVDALPRDGSLNLIDTRPSALYRRGHIDGFKNIPLDQLRQRMEEIDPEKPVWLNCQTALTSYISCRILMQHGYDCRHLSGAYRLYEMIATNRSNL